jgi:hypothetical protein
MGPRGQWAPLVSHLEAGDSGLTTDSSPAVRSPAKGMAPSCSTRRAASDGGEDGAVELPEHAHR